MKQRVTESIDRFAFRFKNNLHRLAKLGEPVDRNSPQFIMSQFTSKTKPDIQKHLVLKAEEYKDLSEIIEVAKRIERSFSPSHTQPNKQLPEQSNAPATNPAPGFPRCRGKAIPMAILKETAPKKRRKTTILRIPEEVTKFAVYGTNINDLPAFYQTNHADVAVFTTVTLVPSRGARILIIQTLVHLLQTPAKFNHHRHPNWDHALLNHRPQVFSLSLPILRYF